MNFLARKRPDWLEETGVLDLSHPGLQNAARKVLALATTPQERALAIHSFVRLLPFDPEPGASDQRASEVLGLHRAECHAKGTLFVALCRLAGIPARLQFVRLTGDVLHGLMPTPPATLTHAVAQVRLDGQWVCTDGYVLDPALYARARQALTQAGRRMGWGLHRDAPPLWDGRHDCLQQFAAEDVIDHDGPFHDLADRRLSLARRSPRGLLLHIL